MLPCRSVRVHRPGYAPGVARMVPFPMLPTDSAAERRLYEGFLAQLDDEYVVYHSVDWVLAGPNGPDEGEADFVVEGLRVTLRRHLGAKSPPGCD